MRGIATEIINVLKHGFHHIGRGFEVLGQQRSEPFPPINVLVVVHRFGDAI